jgi:hypothetical protein
MIDDFIGIGLLCRCENCEFIILGQPIQAFIHVWSYRNLEFHAFVEIYCEIEITAMQILVVIVTIMHVLHHLTVN